MESNFPYADNAQNEVSNIQIIHGMKCSICGYRNMWNARKFEYQGILSQNRNTSGG